MRYINKSNRCQDWDDFTARYKSKLANKKWDNFTEFRDKKTGEKNVGRKVKITLHHHLWKAQKGICIYCQKSIIPDLILPKINTELQNELKSKSHIEHILSKEQFPTERFKYNNLSVSCEGIGEKKVTNEQLIKRQYCGHKKDENKTFDYKQLLHPCKLRDIASYFIYDFEGNIKPNPQKTAEEQAKAAYMIKRLHLQNPTLVQYRTETYLAMLNLAETDIKAELNPSQTHYPSFYSMLKQLFDI